MMQVKRRPFLSSVGLAYIGYMHVIPASQGSGGRGMDRALAKKSYMKALELSKTESSKELGNPSRADQVLSCLSYEALSRVLCRLSSFVTASRSCSAAMPSRLRSVPQSAKPCTRSFTAIVKSHAKWKPGCPARQDLFSEHTSG